MSVCLSIRQEALGPNWTGFREFIYWGFLLKSVDHIQIWLRSGENNRHYVKTYILMGCHAKYSW